MGEQQIIAAFLRLIRKADYSKITINQVMAEANLTRTYFYQFFDDKKSLAREAVFSLIKEFFNCMSATFTGKNQIDHQSILKGVNFLIDHKKDMQLLLSVQEPDFNLQTEFQKGIKELVKKQISVSKPYLEKRSDYFAELFSVSAITTISWVLKQDNVTAAEVTDLIEKCASTGLLSILY